MPGKRPTKTIFDGDYSDYYHGLTKKQYDTLQEDGRVWISLKS